MKEVKGYGSGCRGDVRCITCGVGNMGIEWYTGGGGSSEGMGVM